jgi:uncharacterized damage-inducible protein DinB
MNTIDLLVRGAIGSGEMLKMTLADFTEAEMLTRPCPGANHPLWQLGHLCVAETNLINAVKPGSMPELPAGLAERFENKKTNGVDDPSKLATKQQLMDIFAKTRQATIAAMKTFSEADLDKPSPERFQKMFPTVGEILAMQTSHVMMHLGQIQVARRKLGKPILF